MQSQIIRKRLRSPAKLVTNDQLAQVMDYVDAWIASAAA